MSKVVTIRNVALVEPGAVDEGLLAGARKFLELVEAGQIVGVVLAAERQHGPHWVLTEGPFGIEPMIGHMEREKLRLLHMSEDQQPG